MCIFVDQMRVELSTSSCRPLECLRGSCPLLAFLLGRRLLFLASSFFCSPALPAAAGAAAPSAPAAGAAAAAPSVAAARCRGVPAQARQRVGYAPIPPPRF